MVESLVLRLRRLRAAIVAAFKRMINGQRPFAKVAMITEVSTSAWEAERAWRARQGEKFESARASLLVNAVLLALLITSAISAPLSGGYSWLCWGVASACTAALTRRGVDWQHAWHDASLKLTGWW